MVHHPGAEFVVFVQDLFAGNRVREVIAVNPEDGGVTRYQLSDIEGWAFIVDGGEFLYSKGGDLWALDLSDGTNRKFAKGPFVLVDILPEKDGKRIAVGFGGDHSRCIAELSDAPPKVLLELKGGSGYPVSLYRRGDAVVLGWLEEGGWPLTLHECDWKKKELRHPAGGARLDLGGVSLDERGLLFSCGGGTVRVPYQTVLEDFARFKNMLYVRTATEAWADVGGHPILLDPLTLANHQEMVILTPTGLCLADQGGIVTLSRADGTEKTMNATAGNGRGANPAFPRQ